MNKSGDAECKDIVKQTSRCKMKQKLVEQENQIRYGKSTLQRI